MSINLGIKEDGKITISSGPLKPRKEDLNKWLNRNTDAVLVKLEGNQEPTFSCSVGHVCRIEKGDDKGVYNVFVGGHLIGQLPDEGISFAEHVDSSPEFLISIVGKIVNNAVYVYIAE